MRYFFLALLFAACTDSHTTAAVQATGTIGGKPLALQSAAANIITDTKGSYLLVYLSPLADACTAPMIVPSDGTAIELSMYKQSNGAIVADADLTSYSTTVGGAGPWTEVDTFDRNADCTAAAGEGKGDGNVTLTQASGGVYAGSFDFTIHGTDHVTGTFTTDACAWTEPTTICQ